MRNRKKKNKSLELCFKQYRDLLEEKYTCGGWQFWAAK